MQEEIKKKKRNKGRRKKRPKKRVLLPRDFYLAGMPRLCRFGFSSYEMAAYEYMRILALFGNRWRPHRMEHDNHHAQRNLLIPAVIPFLTNAKDAARFSPVWRAVYKKRKPMEFI
jgi:hypothetical protein